MSKICFNKNEALATYVWKLINLILPTMMMNEELLSFTSKLIKRCPVQGQAKNQSSNVPTFVLFGINSNMATHHLLKLSALPAVI